MKAKQQIRAGEIASPTTCFLNSDNIKFPLTIRTWKTGDYFYPLGMKGKKLLSDFFTDEKYSHLEKENQLLLLTKNDVLWVIGKRIDDRYKITDSTKNVLKITFNDKR
jgi:tRNA(Ile)-lysidine synthase